MAADQFLHRPCAEFGAARAAVDFLDLPGDDLLQFGGARQCGVEPVAHLAQFAPHRPRNGGDLAAREILRVRQADRGARQCIGHQPHFLAAPDHEGQHPDQREGGEGGGRDQPGFERAEPLQAVEPVAAPEKGRFRAQQENTGRERCERDLPARPALDQAEQGAGFGTVLIGGADLRLGRVGGAGGLIGRAGLGGQIVVFHEISALPRARSGPSMPAAPAAVQACPMPPVPSTAGAGSGPRIKNAPGQGGHA